MDAILYIVVALLVAGVLAWVVTKRVRALPPTREPTAALPRAAEPAQPMGEPSSEPSVETEAPKKRERADTVRETPREPEALRRPSAVPLPVEKPARAVQPRLAEAVESVADQYRRGLAKTRGGFVAKLARLVRGRPKVDADLRDRIEEVLFTADIGTSTASKLLERVTEALDKKQVADPDAVWSVIRAACLEILDIEAPAADPAPTDPPYVLLAIGVNGVGKTTTLGKLAARHVADGNKVLLVAGDTFRAAAVEQLEVWARRVGCEIHMGADKADPSAVIYDGILRGHREGFDVVLCDTAGRLHTKKELMDELAKVGRAAAKAVGKVRFVAQPANPAAPVHDTYLVLDATIGQNALAQAQMFKEAMQFTGLVVTKLDGTAKGGVVLGICDEMRIPIRYVGIGEKLEDLREFSAALFVDALLEQAEPD